MESEPKLPDIDTRALASMFLRRAQQPDDLRITISAEQQRALAQKRIRLAWLTLPFCLLLGVSALLLSLNLALLAVVCGFFAYACVTIALRQRDAIKNAADFEVLLSGKHLRIAEQEPRTIHLAVNRPDYLRMVLIPDRTVAFWLDNRRDPGACCDLPATPEHRRELCTALAAAGVEVRQEGAVQRVVILLGGLAVALFMFNAVHVAEELTATLILTSPRAWVCLAMIGVGSALFWLRSRSIHRPHP